MGSTQYQKAKKFVDLLKKDKVVWDFEEFRIEIIKKLGSDEYKTLRPYVKLMLDTKLVSSEDENVRIN